MGTVGKYKHDGTIFAGDLALMEHDAYTYEMVSSEDKSSAIVCDGGFDYFVSRVISDIKLRIELSKDKGGLQSINCPLFIINKRVFYIAFFIDYNKDCTIGQDEEQLLMDILYSAVLKTHSNIVAENPEVMKNIRKYFTVSFYSKD